MIIEGILATTESNGDARISPMGAVLASDENSLELRPFTTSATFQNLQDRRCGVFHLTDDAMLFAQAVTKRWRDVPKLSRAHSVPGWIIPATYRWFEFEVVYIDHSNHRAMVQCRIVRLGNGLPFAGACRAKHAIIEASIAVSRLSLLPTQEVENALAFANRICEKTGGERERLALQILTEHLSEGLRSMPSLAEPNPLICPSDF